MGAQLLADNDALTGLQGRKGFQARVVGAIDAARTSAQLVALVHIGLDRFKVINGTLGHDAGDELLGAFGARLRDLLGESAPVARLGADEFVLLLEGETERAKIREAVERLRGELGGAFFIAEQEVFVTVSLGVALFPDDAETANEFFANADKALQRAKHAGRDNGQFFVKEMRGHDTSRLALERDLRRAIEREEFVVFYQPQVNVTSGRVTGVEALIRWQRPGIGMVPPMEFIPLLEETGLIVPVGAWVLKTACEQAQRWRAEGIDSLRVAVNISASQLRQNRIADLVEKVLAETNISPSALELELTEGLLIENTVASSQVLHRLREMGISISLDDFGTGYSSLSYLKRLPIDLLKIDRSFVRDVLSDPADRAIAAAIVDLAHALKLLVVAEGIETDDQLAFMRSLGCDAAQGYLIGRPMPAAACGAWIAAARLEAIPRVKSGDSVPPTVPDAVAGLVVG